MNVQRGTVDPSLCGLHCYTFKIFQDLSSAPVAVPIISGLHAAINLIQLLQASMGA